MARAREYRASLVVDAAAALAVTHCGGYTATNWDTTDALTATQRPAPKGKYQMARVREYRASLVVVLLLRLLRLPLLLRLY